MHRHPLPWMAADDWLQLEALAIACLGSAGLEGELVEIHIVMFLSFFQFLKVYLDDSHHHFSSTISSITNKDKRGKDNGRLV